MRPLHRFTVDGYGPVVVRGLEQPEVELVAAETAGDAGLALVAFLRAGAVRPDVYRMTDEQLRTEFGERPDALLAIGDRIVAESWPYTGGSQ